MKPALPLWLTQTALAAVVGFAGLAACDREEEVNYTQFNTKDDSFTLQIGPDADPTPITVTLYSTTGTVEVGSATVDPGGGPVGTIHRLTVSVEDAYEDQVVRVTVRTQSPGRGSDEYMLTGDSADEGLWQIELVSAGDADEVREDTFTIRLWEVEGATTVQPADDTGSQ